MNIPNTNEHINIIYLVSQSVFLLMIYCTLACINGCCHPCFNTKLIYFKTHLKQYKNIRMYLSFIKLKLLKVNQKYEFNCIYIRSICRFLTLLQMAKRIRQLRNSTLNIYFT